MLKPKESWNVDQPEDTYFYATLAIGTFMQMQFMGRKDQAFAFHITCNTKKTSTQGGMESQSASQMTSR